MDKLADLIGGLKDYFNDFVGAVIPGAALAAGTLWLCADHLPVSAFSIAWGEWNWLPGLAIIFMMGHALLSLHELVSRTLAALRQIFDGTESPRPSASGSDDSSTAGKTRKISPTIIDKAQANAAYKAFGELITPRLTSHGVSAKLDFNSARNIAMSLSANGAELGRRFMFISLFCYGASMAAWVIAVLDVALLFGGFHKDWMLKLALVFLLICTALLLRRRGTSFELRALTVPFSVAIAELLAPVIGKHLESQAR